MNTHQSFRDHQSLLTRIDVLTEENRQLRDRIATLTGSNDMATARKIFGLTESEGRIFMLLVSCGAAESQHIWDAVYHDGRLEELDNPNLAMRSHMKRMRRKTRRFGVDFETVYSWGYRMADDVRANARRIIAGASQQLKQQRMTYAEYRASVAQPKRNKYGACKTVLDGITFDSKAEANRWAVLRQQQRLGLISNLRRQVWHHLKAANGAVACRYRADFDYDDADGNPVTEDSKGFVTRDFKIKARLFKEQYGREIKVVRSRG